MAEAGQTGTGSLSSSHVRKGQKVKASPWLHSGKINNGGSENKYWIVTVIK